MVVPREKVVVSPEGPDPGAVGWPAGRCRLWLGAGSVMKARGGSCFSLGKPSSRERPYGDSRAANIRRSS